MRILSNDFYLSLARESLVPRCKQLRTSLIHQASALGVQSTTVDLDSPAGTEFILHHPALAPVSCEITSPGNWLSPAYQTELILQAASGVMSVHGRATNNTRPLAIHYVSVLCSAIALLGALACAIGQLRGGSFRRVGVSPLGCGHLSIAQYLAEATAMQNRGRSDLHSRDSHPLSPCPPFVSADDVAFELETLRAEPWRRFWDSVGIGSDIAGQAWKSFLLRYATATCVLPSACIGALHRLPFEQISNCAHRAGIAVVRVRRLEDRQSDPDYPESRLNPWRFQEMLYQATGRDTATPLQRPMHPPMHLPLQGLKVLESCRRIQGPLAGHLLALMGAQVTRVEPPGGDPLRAMSPCVDGCSVRFSVLNHLKSVVETDIRSSSGRDRIHELANASDVFIHNWAPGKAEQLQLTPQRLHVASPGLVYVYAGGWHQANISSPATDFTVQAWSGVASTIATGSRSRGGSLFTVLDVLGGVVCALATTAAILRRTLRKSSLSVETSLLGTADLLMLSGAVQRSANTASGVFGTREGLIAIDCQSIDQTRLLARVLGAPHALTDWSGLSVEKSLNTHFNTRSAREWEAELNSVGISACTVTEDLAALSEDPRLTGCFDTGSYCTPSSPWSFQ